MIIYRLFFASLTIGLLLSMSKPDDRYSSNKDKTSIEGQISIATNENHLKVKLSYLYEANDASDSLSLFLAPELKIPSE